MLSYTEKVNSHINIIHIWHDYYCIHQSSFQSEQAVVFSKDSIEKLSLRYLPNLPNDRRTNDRFIGFMCKQHSSTLER